MWTTISDFPGYEVSSGGSVRRNGRELNKIGSHNGRRWRFAS